MHRYFSAFVLTVVAQPLWAAPQTMACTFVTECYQDQGCDSTAYDVSFARNTNIDPVWTMSDVSGDRTAHVSMAGETETTLVQAEGPSAAHLMMLGPDGAARYVVMIFEDPQIITYHGTCEGFE